MLHTAANLLRYAHLIARWGHYARRISNPIHVCLSVDFDLRYKTNPEAGYHLIEDLYREFGLAGRVTYLINPRYDLGAGHPIYRAIHAAGNEIGLHTHAEQLILNNDEAALLPLMREQKALVEERFRLYDPGFTIRSFRSGSRAFSPALFSALAKLDIRYDSTMAHRPRRRVIHGVPLDDGCDAGRVYYLDPARGRVDAAGCRADSPVPTPIVELPVTSQLPDLAALLPPLRPGEPLVLATFVHPYNFHFEGRPNRRFIAFYRFALRRLAQLPNARFSHLAEAAAAWEACRAK